MIPYSELRDQSRARVDSDDWRDRMSAAVFTHGLDKLVHDSHPRVLEAVAANYYGLDLLIKNPNESVRGVVERLLERNNQTIDEWIAVNPESCAIPANRAHISSGIAYADLSDAFKELVDSPDEDTRVRQAAHRIGLDKLVYDESPYVRAEVANQNYGLNILVDDPDDDTRETAYSILDDKSPKQWAAENPDRIASAAVLSHAQAPIRPVPYDELSFTRKTFVDSPFTAVRRVAVESGDGVDKLINDPDPTIRAMAKEVLYNAPNTGPIPVAVDFDDEVPTEVLSRDEDPYEITTTEVPAQNLPDGWKWVMYGDGSGHLSGPDGESYFGYDTSTHEMINVYGRWSSLDGSIDSNLFRVQKETELAHHLGLFTPFDKYADYPWTEMLSITGGNKEYAAYLIDFCDWQSPETTIEEHLREGEIVNIGGELVMTGGEDNLAEFAQRISKEMGNVLVDKDGTMHTPFYGFAEGTNIDELHSWFDETFEGVGTPAQKQTSKTVDIPKAKTQADAATTLNQDATQLTTPTKEQTQDTKQVR